MGVFQVVNVGHGVFFPRSRRVVGLSIELAGRVPLVRAVQTSRLRKMEDGESRGIINSGKAGKARKRKQSHNRNHKDGEERRTIDYDQGRYEVFILTHQDPP